MSDDRQIARPNPSTGRRLRAEIDARWLSPVEPSWGALNAESAHDSYHAPAYVILEARRLGGEPVALAVQENKGEDRSLLLPLVIRSLPRELGPEFADCMGAMSPYGYSGPILGGGPGDRSGWDAEACRAMLLAMRQWGVCCAFVRLHTLHPQPVKAMREWERVVEHGATVWIDLTNSDGQYWSQMPENHRRVIRRLRKDGVTVAMESSLGALVDFVRIYHETMCEVGAAPSYRFPVDYFAGLRSALGNGLHLCTVRREGELLAGGLFLECCGIVQYHLGATATRHRSLSPSSLMIDFVRSWSRARGDQSFHLGGGVGARQDSLFHFKAGFSPLRAPFCTWRAIADQERYDAATRRWRSLLPSVPLADPDFFPLYRSPIPATPGGSPPQMTARSPRSRLASGESLQVSRAPSILALAARRGHDVAMSAIGLLLLASVAFRVAAGMWMSHDPISGSGGP